MKSRPRVYAFMLMAMFILPVSVITAQETAALPIDPSNPAFRTQFNHIEFNGRFALLATTDVTNNYFLVNFKQFPTKFEKVWFLNLVFGNDKIVNIDPEIDRDRLWFLAKRQYSEQEILDEFEELKSKTFKESSRMTETEKSAWMEIHDKYKS